MQPTSYSTFTIQGANLFSIIELYGEWIVGQQEFSNKRGDRLKIGVPEDLTADALTYGGDFGVTDRSFLRSRFEPTQDEGQWLLHWTHLDLERDEIVWHNIVRLKETAQGISTEHLVGRTFPPDACPLPIWAPPVVLLHLVRKYGNNLLPKDLFNDAAIRVNADDVDEFVKYVLLTPEREAPVVLISPRNYAKEFLVDPDYLARKLAGMAMVAALNDPAACWDLEGALNLRMYEKSYGCYDGAIRLYWPKLRLISEPYDHPLWTASKLLRIPAAERANKVLGFIGEAIANQVSTYSWLSIIQDIDLANWKRGARALLQTEREREVPTPPKSQALREAIEERDREISELKESLKVALERTEETEKIFDELAEQHRIACDDRDRLKEHLNQVIEEKEKVFACYSGIESTEEAISLAVRCFPDQLVILKSAVNSAKKSPYRRPKELFLVLSLIALSAGSGGEALNLSEALNKLLGNRARYKDKDHKGTNKAFGDDRTFRSSNGEERQFRKHITLGGAVNPRTCMQVYFHYLPPNQVEIAYAGEHLRTTGKDT